MEGKPVLKAVIMVGGPSKGTRFRPLSMEGFPKPLFPVGGKPMVYHHIKACCEIEGMKEIFLLGYNEEKEFQDFLQQMEKKFNIKISYLHEETELGTAGGLYKFREQILADGPESIFVLHCDIACPFPLKEMLAFHREKVRELGIVGTLLGSKVNPEYSHHYGCLVEDDQHRLQHYAEKPSTHVSDLINSGVYCFSPKIFDTIKDTAARLQSENSDLPAYLSNVWRVNKESVRLEQDILIPLSDKSQFCVFANNSFWRQIKNAGAPVYCNELYLDLFAKTNPSVLAPKAPNIRGNVIIHKTAQVHPTALLGPNVTVGKNVKIGPGVRISHSIILDDAEIKDRACVSWSIIGWNSIVGPWSRVEGIPNPTPDMYVNKIRKGICIVGRDSVIAPELIILNCIVMPHKTKLHSFTTTNTWPDVCIYNQIL